MGHPSFVSWTALENGIRYPISRSVVGTEFVGEVRGIPSFVSWTVLGGL